MPNFTSGDLLAREHLEMVEAWGMSRSSLAYVHRPTVLEQARLILLSAADQHITVAPRGAGCSYGDASLNGKNVVLDMSRMNRILAWNPESGRIEVEPGVTMRRLWQYCIEDGWWPPVVSGTMAITLGGAAAMNVHGKNNFSAGPIGDHISEFDILLPTGEVKTCNRDSDRDLFHAAIGGFGMLGIFTRLVIQMKRIHSGLLRVEGFGAASFGQMIDQLENRIHSADYLVGWVDCFATGDQIGRGLIHQANYLATGEDREPAQSLRVENQELPDTLFGVAPKSAMWRMMRPFTNNLGVRAVNTAKFAQGQTLGNHKLSLQPLAQFSFLLDYVPNWKFAYKPGGLIQFQSFIPKDRAEAVFRKQILMSQKSDIVPYLGVLKRHRPDDFLMTHAVDGYSLALDYPITDRNIAGLRVLIERCVGTVLDNGGRFYFAKDSMLTASAAHEFLGQCRVQTFAELKGVCDPRSVLESELSRRLFPEMTARSAGAQPKRRPTT